MRIYYVHSFGRKKNKLRNSCPTISLRGQNMETSLTSHYIELEWSNLLEDTHVK